MREGERVSYIGQDPLLAGEQGRVVVTSGDHAHVMWSTGARVNKMDLILQDDLMPTPVHTVPTVASHLSESLVVQPLVTCAVREVVESDGEQGLVEALAAEGHLANLADAAEDTVEYLASRIRNDSAITEVLGQLDEAEGDAVVVLVAQALLRDTLGAGES